VLPQISPLPNLPVYYAGYKTWAHYRAWRGAQSLQGIVLNIDRKQLVNLRLQLLDMQSADGRHFEEGTWPAELLALSPRYQAIFDATQPKGTSGDMHSDIGLVATLRGSSELEEILVPSRRWEQPVDDTAISQAAAIFHFPSRDVLAHVDRARNQALASAAR